MPLTKKVTFQKALQKGNRAQVPQVNPGQFKIESNQILRIDVNALNLGGGWPFLCKNEQRWSHTYSTVDIGADIARGKAKPWRLHF